MICMWTGDGGRGKDEAKKRERWKEGELGERGCMEEEGRRTRKGYKGRGVWKDMKGRMECGRNEE